MRRATPGTCSWPTTLLAAAAIFVLAAGIEACDDAPKSLRSPTREPAKPQGNESLREDTSRVDAQPSVATEASAPPLRPLGVVDFHVDLGWAAHTSRANEKPGGRGSALSDENHDASLVRLERGEVGTLVVPLYVSGAYAMAPADARREYERTFEDARALFARDGRGRIGEPFAPAVPGKIRVRVSFEGADGFVDAPEVAEKWAARGVCLFGLVHSRSNALGGSSQDPSRDQRKLGLTDAGKALARRLVARGVLLDVAHASDTTADDLLAIAERAGAPVVDSHTGARAKVAIDRNLDDAHILRVARTGGLVALSLHSGHVSSHRGERATLEDVVAHAVHLKNIAGADHIAIGSDLEGDILLPAGVDGAGVWPELARRLTASGFSDADLRKLFRENGERVFSWAEAHGCGSKSLAN